ncbi:DUF1206 domain-containing protein [Virgibacillus flavescens]|uniref:DUF1206 domain-containing protein n=1 Tax=Virgibacillus flavescens TaxID=1611422 RepID=UPI003D356DC0
MDDMKSRIKSFLKRKDADDRLKPWVRWYSRIGFSAKGTVYALIGIISMLAAVGIGQKSGQQGAIASIASKPFGELIIWVIVLGLTGYITWLITQVIIEPDNVETRFKGILIRMGFFFYALIYMGIAAKFATIAMRSGQSGSSKQAWMAKVIEMPFGRVIIGLIGLGILIFAAVQIIRGITGSYLKELKTHEMEKYEQFVLSVIGKIGYIARGLTFGVLGGFIAHAGWIAEPNSVTGIDSALAQISQEPYGKTMLGIISLGLLLYGIFTIFEGKKRNIQVKKD